MARIRTIKPEFPQSESMGRVSRDARLFFILLWTVADDYGRLRGDSRLLASLLLPYDDDSRAISQACLDELSAEGCITTYTVGLDSYIQINNWDKHQKIDRPSGSKFPENPVTREDNTKARESSRGQHEGSSLDQGSRIKDQGVDQGGVPPKTKARPSCIEEVRDYMLTISLNGTNPERFWDFYESKGWLVGKSPMRDWKAACRNWKRTNFGGQSNRKESPSEVYDRLGRELGLEESGFAPAPILELPQ